MKQNSFQNCNHSMYRWHLSIIAPPVGVDFASNTCNPKEEALQLSKLHLFNVPLDPLPKNSST